MVKGRTDWVYIAYTLEFAAPFHCGTGMRVGLLDRTVVRDHGKYLYVPGSTIKGVLREKCEQLACFCSIDEKKANSPHDKLTALQDLGVPPTMVTRIFGSHMLPGHLFFEDACQSEAGKQEYDEASAGKKGKGRYQNLQVTAYTQVRLDRPTRIAVPGALYTSEFGARNMKVEGSITGSLTCLPMLSTTGETPTYSLLLLLAGLHLLDQLGGNKSTGKGQCLCTIQQVMLNDKELEKAHWQGWLENLGELALYTEAQEEETHENL